MTFNHGFHQRHLSLMFFLLRNESDKKVFVIFFVRKSPHIADSCLITIILLLHSGIFNVIPFITNYLVTPLSKAFWSHFIFSLPASETMRLAHELKLSVLTDLFVKDFKSLLLFRLFTSEPVALGHELKFSVLTTFLAPEKFIGDWKGGAFMGQHVVKKTLMVVVFSFIIRFTNSFII